MIYIQCDNITLGYDKNVISDNINFHVKKGDYLCIIGENGAGKSTLIKTILNLIKPLSGKVTFANNLLTTEVGYLPQQTELQRDFPASVWEIVLSGNLAKSSKKFFYTNKDKEIALENIKRMDILKLKDKAYKNLSGGQQQRVLLARALCATSKIILLDEPVSGLDPKVTSDFYDLVKKLNNEGLTVIMVSHDMKAAVKYATNILHLGKKQLFFGTSDEYMFTDLWKAFGSKEGVYA